jgi:hypothetical protein
MIFWKTSLILCYLLFREWFMGYSLSITYQLSTNVMSGTDPGQLDQNLILVTSPGESKNHRSLQSKIVFLRTKS